MFLDKVLGRYNTRCTGCGRKTSALEEYYYDGSCEKCESKYLKRMEKE